MLGAQPLGFAGRMQRIGKQQEGIDQFGLVGGQHGGLAPAIGLPAEGDSARDDGAQGADSLAQPGTVGGGTSRRWRTCGTALAKRQVYGDVDIDSIAGPSEVVVIADGSTRPDFAAADLPRRAKPGAGRQSFQARERDWEWRPGQWQAQIVLD